MYAGSVRLFLPDNTGKISEARMGRDPGYLTEMMMMINLDKVGTYQLPGLFPLKKPPYPLKCTLSMPSDLHRIHAVSVVGPELGAGRKM